MVAVEFIVVFRIIYVELMGRDANDWAVLLVHATNLGAVLTFLYHIEVELVPKGQRCEFRAWEVGEGAEVPAMNHEPQEIEECGSNGTLQ